MSWPFLAVFFSGWLFVDASYRGPRWQRWVFKPVTLLLLLLLAWQAPVLSAAGYLIVLGLLATLIGDALLLLPRERVLYAIGAFFLSHLLYTLSFASQMTFSLFWPLPLALLGYLAVCGQLALSEPAFALPFGPRPEVFIPLMLVIGVFCSWLGALCWNEASQRLPTVLVGPLIVFEILAGLAYTFLLRQAWPPLLTLAGIVCLIAGVVYAMRIKPQPVVVALEEKQG